MVRIAVALLVDEAGDVLLQERDEFAPSSPDQWGMVGGHVEDGEDFDTAIVREIEEETGLRLGIEQLSLWRDDTFRYDGAEDAFHYHVYVGRVGATDDDIVVGEGRQIVFVAPGRLPSLDLAESCAHFVPAFVASAEYRALMGE